MADPTTIPPATKTRTIAHMNKDHRTDLQHMLQHYNGLSADSASNPELLDINLTSLTITASGKTHTITLNPPMASWDERRQRLIDMTLAARSALGIPSSEDEKSHSSPKTVAITTYTPPSPADFLVAIGVSLCFASYGIIKLGLLTPGTEGFKAYAPFSTFLHSIINTYWPFGGVAGYSRMVTRIFFPVLLIHVAEAWLMDRTRLREGAV